MDQPVADCERHSILLGLMYKITVLQLRSFELLAEVSK